MMRRFISKLSWPSKSGFRHQLVAAYVIGIVLLAALSSMTVSVLSSRAVEKKILEEGLQITDNFASQSTLALLYHSPANAEDAIEAVLNFPDVEGVAIYDVDQFPLVSRGEAALPPEQDATWPDSLELVVETGEAWYWVAPVYTGGESATEDLSPFGLPPATEELIGYVRVVIGKGTLDTLTGTILTFNLVVTGSLAGILLLILLAMTDRLMRPLAKLADTMRRAESGEKHVRAEIAGPRDVVRMERAFNSMMLVLDERERELIKARDVALESARIKGEFAANVSHELRTPLNGILGMLELLQGMGLTSKQLEYVQVAEESSEALLKLINEILDFSRNEAGKAKAEPVDFDLQEMLDDLMGLLGEQAQRKGLEIAYVIDRDVPRSLHGDETRIRQVLINLIGNAIKFTATGEVEIDVSLVDQMEGQLRLRFDVRDTGAGIPQESQNRLFEAFYQADGSTSREHGGTGLGLAISRQLVQLMDGNMGVASAPGEGSDFWFTVLVQVASDTIKDEAQLHSMIAGLRVLCVDDSPVTLRYLEQHLKDWGIYYRCADNGRDALDMVSSAQQERRSFDLIIVDRDLQGVRGRNLVSQLLDDDALSARVLVMSGDGSVPALRGIAGSVRKPLRSTQLFECIADAMRSKEQQAHREILTRDEPSEKLTGRRVLIVEDNAANQQVAAGMIERLGCVPEVVGSGREAIDAIHRSEFDLVLMDCQMPTMDGYQTTREIRAFEGDTAHTLIVAMTANVQEGDRDKCLAAGMDDYLPKPLKLLSLRTAMEKWLGPMPAAPDVVRVSQEPSHAPSTPSLDVAALQELKESIGDSFGAVVTAFIEDMPRYIDELRSALGASDLRAVAELAHAIKGSSGNLAATALAATARRLEEQARGGRSGRMFELLEALSAEYHAVRARLAEEIGPEVVARTENADNLPQILIVDDDRSMRLALSTVLERDGYCVTEAQNGQQALVAANKRMPELIIMDALMPVMDGFDACERIRGLLGGEDIPILMVTALENDHDVERAFDVGATDYIAKPVHFAVLRQRVKRLLAASLAHRQVQHLAYNDTLTGLPNRLLFAERLEGILSRASQGRGRFVAVALLDIDRFQIVNDTLGHDIGDVLIKTAAERINRCVRPDDLVARMGGDEFAIAFENARSREVVEEVASNILSSIAQPFAFLGKEMYVSASIGIALHPEDGGDVHTLMRHADTAMYRAKERGARYRFYEYSMEAAVSRRLGLENELRGALERDEFVVHYQPQLDLGNDVIFGVEALVRWQSSQHGLVPPDEFIGVCEDTGLIHQLGERVMRVACGEVSDWTGRGFGPFKIGINLSARQLEEGDL
ncbi:MAG: response regulator, partial [Chromatiales bacterium]